MKTDLSTFPDVDLKGGLDSAVKMLEWVAGFEAELREMLVGSVGVYQSLLYEILGEDR